MLRKYDCLFSTKFITVFRVVAAFHDTEFYGNILARLNVGLNVVSLYLYPWGFIELRCCHFFNLDFLKDFDTSSFSQTQNV